MFCCSRYLEGRLFCRGCVNASRHEKRPQFLVGQHIIDIRIMNTLELLGDARPDEHFDRIGIALGRHLGRVRHGRTRAGDVLLKIRCVLLDSLRIGRTTGCTHHGIAFLQTLDELGRFLLCRHVRPRGHLQHNGETNRADARDGLPERARELPDDRWRDHGDNGRCRLDVLGHVDDLRTLHDRAEGTRPRAPATENTQ